MKRLILVTSPPASGKTYVSKKLAERLEHVVYLDKDTLIPLSKRVFAAAGEPYDRSSAFFRENIRDAEYETIVALALEALDYDSTVLINAPFTKEVRDREYMQNLRERLAEKGARLTVIWVKTEIEVVRRRMRERNSERDRWKLENWEEYIAGCDFTIPEALNISTEEDDLFVFLNSTEEEFEVSMADLIALFNRNPEKHPEKSHKLLLGKNSG